MKVKIRKKPFKEVKISIFSNNRYEKIKNVNSFIAINKQVDIILSSVKEDVDFKLRIDLDI
jgi:hypothetical protein